MTEDQAVYWQARWIVEFRTAHTIRWHGKRYGYDAVNLEVPAASEDIHLSHEYLQDHPFPPIYEPRTSTKQPLRKIQLVGNGKTGTED